MLSKEVMTPKEHVNGHYNITETPWATDYVWVPGEEDVEVRLLDEVLRPWHAAYVEWKQELRTHTEKQARTEMETLS